MKRSTSIRLLLFLLGVPFLMGVLSLVAFVTGCQIVSTDKNVYAVGESVTVSWADFRLYRCAPFSPPIRFYRKAPTGWAVFTHELLGSGPPTQHACVNGKLIPVPSPCDVITTEFFKRPLLKGDYTWRGRIYEKGAQRTIGELAPPDIEIPPEIAERRVPCYERRTAPPGRYRVRAGIASRSFEIR